MDDIGHYMVRVSKLSKENQRLRDVIADNDRLLEAIDKQIGMWADRNIHLRDLLSKVEKVHWFCPVCRRADWEVHKHEDDCPVKKELSDDTP